MSKPTYYTSVLASPPGANKVHLSLHNAGPSIISIHRVMAGFNSQAAVAGLLVPLRVARFTAAAPSTGAAITIQKADALAPDLTGITSRSGVTAIPANTTIPFGVGAVTAEETASASQVVLYQHLLTGSRPVQCAPGQGIIVAQHTLTSPGAIDAAIIFTVE